MLTSDQINHIKIIKYSGIFSEYRKEYSEYTDWLKTYNEFAKDYRPLRRMVSNSFDDNVLEKIKLYDKFIAKKSHFSFDLCYEIKLVDYKYFMDAFDQKQYKKLEIMPSVLKYALIEGYNSAIKINQHEKRPDVDVIKPTYSDSEIAEFKVSLFELFPELNKKEEKKDYNKLNDNENIDCLNQLNKQYKREGNKIYFGAYPQTLIKDNILITKLNELAGRLPTRPSKYKWINYNYYNDGKQKSYMYYQDIEIDGFTYRGVYFTQYRPYSHLKSSSISNTYQDDNGYSTNTIYWFSYDPIEWNILIESNDKALILANLILNSQDFYPSSKSFSFSHNGRIGFANNYELSNIRKFLNESFYNTAFNDLQKVVIKKIKLDNSASTTGAKSNICACNNTEDKIFLLSYSEAMNTNYFADDNALKAKGSDYAKCQGLYVSTSSLNLGYSYWWLRSPRVFADDACYVNCDGWIRDDGSVWFSGRGVRPACLISL